jgi:hypothetical protein
MEDGEEKKDGSCHNAVIVQEIKPVTKTAETQIVDGNWVSVKPSS